MTLTVDDGQGETAVDSITITIENNASPLVSSLNNLLEVTDPAFGSTQTDLVTAAGFTATDSCDASPVIDVAPLGPYVVGETTVTFTGTDASTNAASIEVTVRLLSASEQSERLIDSIGGLVDAAALNGGQGNSLVKKLEGVLKQLGKGKGKTALNQLRAMLNQVDSLIDDGLLTPVEGQVLTDAIGAIIAAIENG